MVTVLFGFLWRLRKLFQWFKSGSLSSSIPNRFITTWSRPSSYINIGTSYMVSASIDWITASCSTLQNKANFFRKSSESSCSVRHTKTSALIPLSMRVFTECWVGLVFNSFAADKNGTSVKWITMQFSRPSSHRNWRTASIYGKDSISPTVPPISVITISCSPLFPKSCIRAFISFVICGITCTVFPKKSPRLSFSITLW